MVVTVKLDRGHPVSLSPNTVHTIDTPPPVPGCHYCASIEKVDEPGKPGPLEDELRGLTEG